MLADTLFATAESVVSIICQPTLQRDRLSRRHVLQEEPGGPVGMERKWIVHIHLYFHTLLASNIIVRYFVGCCARDPCDITCAQGNLYPGAFDPKAYGTFPDATCGTGSKFYTCTAGRKYLR